MITREQKGEEVAEISQRLGRAKAAFLVDFKGLDVERVTKLRKLLHPIKAEMKVVKNTLALRALKEHASFDGALRDHLTGNNAFVFAYEDVSAPAKTLTAFIKENEALVLKTGAMDGRNLNEAQIKYLATLPGKPELQAKLLGVLQAPAQKFVATLNEVPSKFVRVLAAYRDQKQKSA
ncbi:MAG: 50S ribosomal protein L10 [Bdellovibrionales bacterium RBG_16_40_8]|nr:MAG: 50S ribosomal protein L10 [Bdellovibrionales bacterium RBG_16_40_8]